MTKKYYKSSIYNLPTDSLTGDLLILNTFSGKLVRIQSHKADIVSEYLSREKVLESESEDFQMLKDIGLIVEEDTNEKELVDFQYNKIIYSKDTLEITIIPTDACNFNCVYCYQHEPYHFMSEETESSVIQFIEKNVKAYKKLYISWFGGEPLLAKNTVIRLMQKIKEICRCCGVALVSRITTNGYELDYATFQSLVSNRVLYYQITLDGIKEIHDIQRPHKNGKGSFDKILNNLKEIRDNSSSNRFQISIRMNISQKVLPYMDEFIELINKEFSNDNRFSMIWEWVRDWGGTKISDVKHELLGGPAAYLKWIDEATKRGIKSTDYFSYKLGSLQCEACKANGFVINYDGTINKCSLALYGENKNADLNHIGNIDSKGNAHIDEKKLAKWVVRREKLEGCAECACYPFCMGVSCPYSVKIKNEDRCDREKKYALLMHLMINKDKQNLSIII